MSRQEEDIREGFELAGFRVVRKIGEGGMGTVYLAKQVRLQRDVALKVLHARLVRKNREFIGRFLREAALAAKLNHPNVIQVIDAGEEGGVYYMAMEQVEGKSVLDLLKAGGAFPETVALEFARQTALALEAAHRHKLIHRDIKPDNLILTREGVVKVADFGLAKNTGAASHLTRAGILMGTPAYISPEQVQGAGADHRSDLYALGITLYEMAAGEKPFRAESVMALLMKHVMDSFPDARKANPTLSEAFSKTIRLLTAKNPAQRYQGASEVLKDLEALPLPPDGRKSLATFLERRFPPNAAGDGDTDRQWAREILEDAKQRLDERDFESAVALLKKGRYTAKNPALRQTFEDEAKRTAAAEEIYWREAREALGAGARLAGQRDYAGAVKSLEEVEKKYPGTEAAREASSKIREIRELGADDGGYQAVRNALARSDLSGARKALEEAREKSGNVSGQTTVETGLEKEVQYLECLERGRAHQARGKWEEGEIAFAKARALFDRKEARVGIARMRFKMYWDRGRTARKQGDSKKERKFLNQAKSALEAENLSFDRKFRERLAQVEKKLDLRQRLKNVLKEGKGYEAAYNWSRARQAYRQALDLVSEEEKGVITRRLALVARHEDAFLDNLLKRIKDSAAEGDNRRAAKMAEVYVGVRKVDPAARLLFDILSRLPDGARWRQGGDGRKIEVKWIADGARMLLVPGGEFQRGSEKGEKDEKPPGTVLVSPFLIDVLPVTNRRYARFLAGLAKSPHPHRYCHPSEPPGKNHTPAHWEEERWNIPELPVVGVDWYDAFAFAGWAGKRLPSEAQWEKAARGPSPRTYPWGETTPTATRCSFFDVGLGGTSPPTDRPSGASLYGVLDLAGNVLEWCLDFFDPGYYSLAASREGDPVNQEETPKRSLRGGSWISVAKCCRTTYRDADHPSRRINYIGFRTVAPAPH